MVSISRLAKLASSISLSQYDPLTDQPAAEQEKEIEFIKQNNYQR